MSTWGLLVLVLDFLGAARADRLASGTGDVGGPFCLAAGRIGVVGVDVDGVGSEGSLRSAEGAWIVADSRGVAPGLVAGDEAVALGFGLFAVDRLRGR